MEQSQGTTRGESQQRSNPCSFLSLPLELRRIIYRHLLIPSPIVTIKRKTYGIKPAILLSNKQIYEEASWVLYRDNDWVLLRINAPFRTFLEGWQLEDDLQRYPIVPLAKKSFTREPCLELNIRKMGAEVRGTAREDLGRFLVSLDGLPRVCQILTAAEDTPGLEIAAKFAEVKASSLATIVDCLEEACGFGSVVVEGLDAAGTKQAITKLMMPESSTQEEIVERINGHEARIVKHIANCRYIQAMGVCQDGMAYIEFILKSAHNWRLDPLFQVLPIHQKFTELALKHAWCCLECGDHQSARQITSLFLGSDPQTSFYRGTLAMRSEGHFYYGLSLVAGGAENAAAFSFFRALALTHTHQKADQALDAMEARLALHDTDTESIRVRQNLQHFRNRRHRKMQDIRGTFAERSKLLLGFFSEFLMSDEERGLVTTRIGVFLDNEGLEVFIDALDSLPSSDSAFIFDWGANVLQNGTT